MNHFAIRNQQSKILLRLARRRARRYQQMARHKRVSLSGVPIFFANSFPKSGTHLLTQVLIGFAKIGPAVNSGLPPVVTFEGNTGRLRPESEILSDLQRLLPGDIAYGHVHAFPGVVSFVCQDSFASYFILRDPRDVVVSHVHYVTEIAPGHILHPYYSQTLNSFDNRLSTSIVGITNPHTSSDHSAGKFLNAPPNGSQPPTLPDINQRFEPFMGWLDRPQVLLLRFEDFITRRVATIGNVLDHAIEHGFTPTCDRETAIRILSEGINPKNSPTFRSGKVGGWHSAFNDQHKELFKDVTGNLLISLGYEQDQDW